jgi:hypothetical protein
MHVLQTVSLAEAAADLGTTITEAHQLALAGTLVMVDTTAGRRVTRDSLRTARARRPLRVYRAVHGTRYDRRALVSVMGGRHV